MKPDKHFAAAVGFVMAAVGLIVLTWVGTTETIHAQREETIARVTATLTNQAVTFSEQIDRQILALDQTLRILVAGWQANPDHFDLEASRGQAVVLNGISRDMVLTDENGIIRQSSVNEAINLNASSLDYFRVLADPSNPGDKIYIGPATIDGIMRQWHMNVARALRYPDGSFAGVIDADYRIAAITDVFSQTDLGAGSFQALVGLDDGKLRGVAGPSIVDPDASVGDTPMFAAIRDANSGVWTGPSASDAVRRIHAFRHLPGLNLAVVVAMSEAEAERPAYVWRQQAILFASCITLLLASLAVLLVHGMGLARRRTMQAAQDRADLAAANAQLEVARAMAAAKAEQLEATLAGMGDGVSIVDAHLCLVEWNASFPEFAGVPAEILRVGLPMERLLHAQIVTGQFGLVNDAEAEVERRMARLRAAPLGVVQRQRPDGRTLELRRNPLPDGGFVTLYTDVTGRELAEAALHQARAVAEAAKTEKSHFVAIVSHEIRTPLNALLNAVRLLSDSVLSAAQQSMLGMARHSGDVLFGLIDDILDLSRMEAGKLSIRPSLFKLRPLLENMPEMFAGQAAKRDIAIRVAIADATPDSLLTDPGRLRQVLLNLITNALKYAQPGEVWLTGEPGHNPDEAVRLSVRDDGPVIAPEARGRLFHPFSRLDRPEGNDPAGTGLGLSICQHLVTLMDGNIGCDSWRSGEDRQGNVFWITLPPTVLPPKMAHGHADSAKARDQALAGLTDPAAEIASLPGRRPPRTRILLTDDIVTNQTVTATLLRREGHHVDVASSGPDAVQAVQAAPYDLVFMDALMPGMDGQEAARIIRTLPPPVCYIPIIALTAAAGPEDLSIFQAAGMNGILAKPVSPARLLDVLRRQVWSMDRATNAPIATLEEGSDMSDKGVVPILSAERIKDLRTNLAPETFARLMEECLLDIDHRLPALRSAILAGSPAAIAAHAHAMVGMAAGYGMAALEARLRAVMAAARDLDMARLGPAIVTSLESDFIEVARILREMLRAEVAEGLS